MSRKITKLKSQVLEILEKYPKARDSDQWLTIKLWCVFYPSRIQVLAPEDPQVNRKYVFLEDIMDLPREDNVKRLRAIIQNVEHRFLPTTWEVARQRKINEDEWKEYVTNITP